MRLGPFSRACKLAFLLATGTMLAPTFVVAQSLPAPDRRPTATNPYNAQLLALEQRVERCAAAEAVVLLHDAYALRDYVDDRTALEQWIAAAAANRGLHPLARDEALHLQSLIDLDNDRLDAAEQKVASLGFVRQWALLGPFDSSAAAAALGPAPEFNPGQTSATTSGVLRPWRVLPYSGPHPWVDVADFVARPGIVFAGATVYSPSEQEIALRFSAESAIAIWVNGAQVISAEVSSGLAFDQYAVAVRFHAGWNQLLLRLERNDSGRNWRFGLRLTGLRGGGIVLSASPARHSTTAAAVSQSPLPAPDDLVTLAARAAEINPRSAEAVETLARMEVVHATGSPLAHMEAAVKQEPTPLRWFRLAEAGRNAAGRFSALTTAIAADSHFLPARIVLAGYYAERGQLEKSRDLLRQALSISPHDYVARKRLADVMAAAGLDSAAVDEYAQIAAAFPAPLWVKRELAERFEDLGWLESAKSLLSDALSEDGASTETTATLARIAERQHDVATLCRVYEHQRRLFPTDAFNLAKLAALAAGSGDFSTAERALRTALELNPESDESHQRLAEVLALEGQAAASRQELARALELNPGLENVRRRLDAASAASSASRDSDAPYLVRSADVVASARRQPPGENASAVVLADIRVQRVYANGLSSVRVQQLKYAATDEGVRELSSEAVQYTPGSEELTVLQARVHKADSRILPGELGGDHPVSEASGAMYYDVRTRAVRFPDVEKGDIVELDYRITPALRANPYGAYFAELVAFRSSLPVRLKRYVLATPADRVFNIHEERMPSPAVIVTNGGQKIYRWEARDVPALASEPRGPALTELAPYVHISTFGSWEEVGRWYAQLIRPQFSLDSALREALARLLASTRDDEQRIRAIHEFVLRNTHYVALEFGIYGYKPYPVSETYARRFGDCKDKASLMVALLQAAGIDAELALVRTRRLGEISQNPASVSIFNHAVVYVPDYDLWLDGTAEYAGLHELPIEDQGAMALVVSLDGRAQLRLIPVTAPAENYTRRTVRARIENDGVIRFTGSAYTRGEDAPGLRREFEIAERQRESFRTRLAEVFPTVRVEDVTVKGAHELDADVNVDFRGELATFAGRRTLTLAASWMPRSYVQTLAPLTSRTQDLLVPAPWTTEEELHFQLPAGADVASLPGDTSFDTPFGAATLRYQRRGSELIVRTSVEFRETRIPPAQYAAFREFCARVEQAFRSEVKVVLAR